MDARAPTFAADIPRRIFQGWWGPKEPAQITAWRETVQMHHPEWEYVYVTDVPPLRNRHIWDAAESLHPANPWQFRADVARYELLHTYGGVWLDCDMEMRAPIDDYMDEPFMGWAVQGRVVNNAVMGFPAEHPALLEIIKRLPRNVARYRPHAITSRKVGPIFITPIIRRYRDVRIYDEEVFYPFRWDNETSPDTGESLFVHHYWNKRSGIYAP